MKATELHHLSPLGALVSYNDGTPMPPARHKKKLRAWKNRNGSALFVKAQPGDPTKSWGTATFTLQESDGPVLVVNRIYDINSDLNFEVTPPAPGTILAYSEFERVVDVRHVFKNECAAKDWALSRRYDLKKCGLNYFMVRDDGRLDPFIPS